MGAGGAVQATEVVVGVEVLRDGGVALLARRLLGVQGHFGTFNHDVVDLKLFPPAAKGLDWLIGAAPIHLGPRSFVCSTGRCVHTKYQHVCTQGPVRIGNGR